MLELEGGGKLVELLNNKPSPHAKPPTLVMTIIISCQVVAGVLAMLTIISTLACGVTLLLVNLIWVPASVINRRKEERMIALNGLIDALANTSENAQVSAVVAA